MFKLEVKVQKEFLAKVDPKLLIREELQRKIKRLNEEIYEIANNWSKKWCNICTHKKLRFGHANCKKCDVGRPFHKVTGRPYDF